MEWKNLFQKKQYFLKSKLIGEIYNKHLVLLSHERNSRYEEGKNEIHCWNLSIQYLPFIIYILVDTNSWKFFNIKSPGPYHFVSKLIINKNSLWMVGGSQEGDLWLATYNLDSKKIT